MSPLTQDDRARLLLAGTKMLEAWLTVVDAIVPPVLPPPPPPPSGPIIFVPAGGNLQLTLDGALGGTTIELEPAATYTGNFVFPKKSSLGPVVLRTRNADTTWAPGTRVTPVAARGMAKLDFLDPFSPVLSTADAAHDFSVVALEVLGDGLAPARTSVEIGRLDMTSLDLVPTNIAFDRCAIHGTAATSLKPFGGHRGLMLNVKNGFVTDCDVRAFTEPGRQSQAIGIFNGPGPLLIQRTYLEATGENFMAGGADPAIPNLVPGDISFLGNWCNKPLAWKATHPGEVTNLLELKNAMRVLIEGNYFSHCWTDGQAGHGVQFTVRNQDQTAPWSTVRDVTFRYNVIDDVEGFAWNILGLDDQVGIASVQAVNLQLLHNLCVNVGGGVQMCNGFNPTLVQHNTILGSMGRLLSFIGRTQGLRLLDNVAETGAFGVTADGDVANGLACLNEGAPGHETHHNVLETTVPWPQGNYLMAPGQLQLRLDRQRRFSGTETSTDGKPLGADIDGLIAKVQDYAW
jgi:hypothetical protein